MSDKESRSIFMFLLLNLSYMLVQMVYGYITNSLGLISDAIHMLFDCLALTVGLVAAVMSKWPPNETYTFGYGRIETLSGFANGVFLMLISISIFFEAIERLMYPPEMNTKRLLLVSFGGLVVNLFGILAFNGHHHHHHHSHGNHDHKHGSGSVGVIISTLLIQRFGWTGFDPLASIAIAALIFASVVPLVRDSMYMLLLRLPDHTQAEVNAAVEQIFTNVPFVVDLPKVQFWPFTESQIVGIVHARANIAASLTPRDEEMPPCPIAVHKPSSTGWNNWSAAQFESEDRKNKFLRFMGIKNSAEKDTGENSAVSSKNASQFDSAISKDYATKIQTDLEKQFNSGLAMRQQTQRGARGGLGF
ncbi:hypothetical protein EV177_007522 [Coemansia sp. RSA 1804]|nr:hypothetical protein EV177_007522 [Coemansia sp. RSA 1804]